MYTNPNYLNHGERPRMLFDSGRPGFYSQYGDAQILPHYQTPKAKKPAKRQRKGKSK